MKKIVCILIGLLGLIVPHQAFAHEAYVLTQQEFSAGLRVSSPNPFAPLVDGHHIGDFLGIAVMVGLSFALVMWLATTMWAAKADNLIKKAKVIGPFLIRLAISSSFFFAAQINAVLGPELSLVHVAGGGVIRFLLYAISIMVFFGIFTEIAALIGLMIFFYLGTYFGLYMITYVNYLGELLVLLLFGSRIASVDRYLFGKKAWFGKIERARRLETPIVRILYGIALVYAGYTIKFQHQQLTVDVYNQYHLKDFFHQTAEFIAAGAGLSEILIGLFIVIGFCMRWTLVISLVFITLSLLYFHEMIWPHVMLYGISFSLFINAADPWTIDRYLAPWLRKVITRR